MTDEWWPDVDRRWKVCRPVLDSKLPYDFLPHISFIINLSVTTAALCASFISFNTWLSGFGLTEELLTLPAAESSLSLRSYKGRREQLGQDLKLYVKTTHGVGRLDVRQTDKVCDRQSLFHKRA